MTRAPRLTDLIRQTRSAAPRLPATPPAQLEVMVEERPLEDVQACDGLVEATPSDERRADESPREESGQERSSAPETPAFIDDRYERLLEGNDAAADYELLEQCVERVYRRAAHGRFDAEGIFDDAAALAERPNVVEALFAETFRPREPRDFLARGAVNTAIYGLRLGTALRYSQEALRDIAFGGLLHKIGLTKLPADLVYAPSPIDRKSLAALREHPRLAREAIRSLGRRFDRIAELVYQSNERVDGSGYPLGLRDGTIERHALVIGLASTFDAITQPRPHRPRTTAFAAVKEILGRERDRFPKPLLREFFTWFSGFPPFSFVRLSSNAVARVIATDPLHPLRPVVVIVGDGGDVTARGRTIRLAEHPALHIIGPVNETEAAQAERSSGNSRDLPTTNT